MRFHMGVTREYLEKALRAGSLAPGDLTDEPGATLEDVLAALEAGPDVLPIGGPCDRWDDAEGRCLGHPVEDDPTT